MELGAEKTKEDYDSESMPPPPPPPLPARRSHSQSQSSVEIDSDLSFDADDIVNNFEEEIDQSLEEDEEDDDDEDEEEEEEGIEIQSQEEGGSVLEEENVVGVGEEGENSGEGEKCPGKQVKGDNPWYMEEEHEDSDGEDEESEEDDEIDENEIDSLLEEGLPKTKRIQKKFDNVGQKLLKAGNNKQQRQDNRKELTIKKLVVLEEKGGNSFEVLPGGWIQIRHNSGMPLYLHRKSRVCTLGKPYYIGTASVRRHSVPLSGIPCLSYRKALEKEQNDKELLEKEVKEMESQQQQQQEEQAAAEADRPSNEAMNLLAKCLNVNVAANNKEHQRFKKHAAVTAVGAVGLDSFSGDRSKLCLKRKLSNQSNSKEGSDCKISKSGDSESESLNKQDQTSSTSNANKDQDSKGESECTVPAAETNLNGEGKDGEAGAAAGKEQTGSELLEISMIPVPANQNLPNHYRRGGGKRNRGGMHGGMKSLLPLAKVETAKENAELYSVAPLDLREYCKPLFKFAEVECKRFKTWKARRNHAKEQKRRQLERPTLPDSAQVIKFFGLTSCQDNDEQMVKKFTEYVFNPNGKSSVCILHEFVQHTLRKQPTYAFKELENAATPYSACVLINETPYGRGYGSSKKIAKVEAAKATLEVLIPQMKGHLTGSKTDSSGDFDITEYFQQVDMDDVRIAKMCTSVSEPSPYTLLLTCLQRNFGFMGSGNIKFEMLPSDLSKGNPTNHFQMSADQYSVSVTASNKREGKQLASQLLLSKIHPHITNFGAFLKMYGNGSIKSAKEKKQEEQQITTLQSKASANSPNWAILNKLRSEMIKLAEEEMKEQAAKEKEKEKGKETPPPFPPPDNESEIECEAQPPLPTSNNNEIFAS